MSNGSTAKKQRGVPFAPGKSGNPNGRKPGSKNKRTLMLERAWQRCDALDFHPIDEMIKLARSEKVTPGFRLAVCAEIQKYLEGPQPESLPLKPQTPEHSMQAAAAAMDELKKASAPLEPPSDSKPA